MSHTLDNSAHQAFEEALEHDPQHLEATKNISILNWKEAKITDIDFLERLHAIEGAHKMRADYWRVVGEVQIARGAMDEAADALEKGLKLSPEDHEIKNSLNKARQAVDEDSGWARCIRTYKGNTEFVSSVAISPNGLLGLSGDSLSSESLLLWDLATGECIHSFKSHNIPVQSVAISPDGKYALSGDTSNEMVRIRGIIVDYSIRLWNLATGECLRTFKGHTDSVNSVAFSPDGRFGLSASTDKTLRLWDLDTRKCIRTFGGHGHSVNSVAISPDGRFALLAIHDKTLRLWELSTGKCLRTFEGHTDNAFSVAISPDGRFGLSGGLDRTLRLWDLATGECLRTFEGHTDSVSSVAISPDGCFGLSGSADKNLRVWELTTARCLRILEGHLGYVVHPINA